MTYSKLCAFEFMLQPSNADQRARRFPIKHRRPASKEVPNRAPQASEQIRKTTLYTSKETQIFLCGTYMLVCKKMVCVMYVWVAKSTCWCWIVSGEVFYKYSVSSRYLFALNCASVRLAYLGGVCS